MFQIFQREVKPTEEFAKDLLLCIKSFDNLDLENTCPALNKIVTFVEPFKSYEDEDLVNEAKKTLVIIELVRDSNQKLRNWGNEQYRELEEAREEALFQALKTLPNVNI